MGKATVGQFHDFFGRFLALMGIEQVEKISKEKIQEVINLLSGLNKMEIVDEFIRFINNGCHLIIDGFVSKVFKKTNIINIPKNSKSFIVRENSVINFLKPVLKREKELENPDPYIDNDLWKYFDGKTVPGIPVDLTSVIYRFLVNLNHGQILDEATRFGIMKFYTYLEGLSIIKKAILSGEVDKKGTGIIVFFKVEGIDTLYRFAAFRYDDGQLTVDVNKVYLGTEWNAGDGACFSN
jgi:hypothetical protein